MELSGKAIRTRGVMKQNIGSNDNNKMEESSCPKPKRMSRAKVWNPQVEEMFRIQQCGWRDLYEYKSVHGEPERWSNGFIKCTRVKSNGYFTYWGQNGECQTKYLNRVKLYEY